MIWFLSTHEVQ